MSDDPLLALHFVLSGLMSIAGLSAMLFRKGSTPHRWAGNLFFSVATIMVASGILLVTLAPKGLLQGWVALPAVYLTLTGWATARRWEPLGRNFTIAGAALGAFIVAAGIPLVLKEFTVSSGGPGGAAFLVVIAALILWFTLLDVKVLRAGGAVGPNNRTARHIWRMGLATSIVSGSTLVTFSKYYPQAEGILLFIPAFLAMGLTIYWLIRTLFFGGRRRLQPT